MTPSTPGMIDHTVDEPPRFGTIPVLRENTWLSSRRLPRAIGITKVPQPGANSDGYADTGVLPKEDQGERYVHSRGWSGERTAAKGGGLVRQTKPGG